MRTADPSRARTKVILKLLIVIRVVNIAYLLPIYFIIRIDNVIEQIVG